MAKCSWLDSRSTALPDQLLMIADADKKMQLTMVMFRRSWALPLRTEESVSRDDSHGESLSGGKLSDHPDIETKAGRFCVFSKRSIINWYSYSAVRF